MLELKRAYLNGASLLLDSGRITHCFIGWSTEFINRIRIKWNTKIRPCRPEMHITRAGWGALVSPASILHDGA